MTISVKSNWTGSESTSDLVRKQIAERWGEDEAKRYNPFVNCFTFNGWLKNGYVVRKEERRSGLSLSLRRKIRKPEQLLKDGRKRFTFSTRNRLKRKLKQI